MSNRITRKVICTSVNTVLGFDGKIFCQNQLNVASAHSSDTPVTCNAFVETDKPLEVGKEYTVTISDSEES